MRSLILLMSLLLSCCDGSTRINDSNETHSENNEIIGKWIVTESNIIPFDHISFCENITLNSVFEFYENGILKVLDSQTGSYCNVEMQQNYAKINDVLKITEYDMIFEYKIEKLTQDSLILRIDHIPKHYFTDTLQNEMNREKEINEIITNGIKITLIRLKSGL